jgi:transposase
VRRLLIGGSPFQGWCPASEVNDRGCPGKPDHLNPLHRHQICWAHIKLDFTANAERTGVSEKMGRRLLELERQMFEQWHRWREGQISRQDLNISMLAIRQAIAIILQEVSDIGCTKREKTPWASTVRTCRKILKVESALWTFLDHPYLEPTNNAADRALRPAVIRRKLSFGSSPRAVRSAKVAFSP